MIIGTLYGSVTDGFSGTIETVALHARITLVSLPPFGGDDDPDWRILVGNPANDAEIGVGWTREFAGRHHVEMEIDDPGLPTLLHAHLVQRGENKRRWSMLWIRGDNGEVASL